MLHSKTCISADYRIRVLSKTFDFIHTRHIIRPKDTVKLSVILEIFTKKANCRDVKQGKKIFSFA